MFLKSDSVLASPVRLTETTGRLVTYIKVSKILNLRPDNISLKKFSFTKSDPRLGIFSKTTCHPSFSQKKGFPMELPTLKPDPLSV